MKVEKWLFSALLLLITEMVFSQSIGIKGGLNVANVQGLDDSNNRTGIHLGVTLELPLSPILFFEMGLLYTGKGAKQKDDFSCDVKANYLELPLLLKYKTALKEGIQFYGAAGLYAAYGLSGKSFIYQPKSDSDFANRWGEADTFGEVFDTKRFDGGISLALGVEIKRMQIGAQYNFGLSNSGFGTNDEMSLGDTKMRNFMISLGYYFRCR